MNPVDAALARRWQMDQAGGGSLSRWTWFEPAFRDCLAACGERWGVAWTLDAPQLCGAFLEWVSVVEQTPSHVGIDAVDRAHFLSGRLLSRLFKAMPVQRAGDPGRAGRPEGIEQDWPEGLVLLCFASTVLQSWRLHLGVSDLPWDEVLFLRHWQSFRENVVEDFNSAGPFLDLFAGLEPVWQFPEFIQCRPALQAVQPKAA